MHTEPGRCLLFVYGSLQPTHQPPVSMRAAAPDRVRGLLYDLGRYPAAVQIGDDHQQIRGYVLDISEAELERLDEYEGVSDGLYRRVRTVTAAGLAVWVYEYARALPESANRPLEEWPVPRQSPGKSGG